MDANQKLLAAAKYAVRVIAEERAGGSTESKRLMTQAQSMLFEAISEADPAYYGKNSDLVSAE
jgi:cellobiose-specific phosphotransferase system component IIA